MACLGKAAALADFVVWDARRLPLRDGVADAVFGDLPFAGSKAIRHQTPLLQPASVVAGKTERSFGACCYAKILDSAIWTKAAKPTPPPMRANQTEYAWNCAPASLAFGPPARSRRRHPEAQLLQS